MTIYDIEVSLENIDSDNFFKQLTFIILDFETLTPKGRSPEPIEIGALRISELKVDRNFKVNCFIKPPKDVEFTSFDRIQTGISYNDVKEALPAEEVLKKFASYVNTDSCILVAQNASYEASIISRFSDNCKNLSKVPFVDTIKLAKFLIPWLQNYKLDSLADYFKVKIPMNRHRALPDVEITVNVFMCLVMMAIGKINSIHELLQIAGVSVKQKSNDKQFTQISFLDIIN